MKKFVRTYLPFMANEFKRQLAYKGAFYLFIFISLFGSFISYYLWMAIYGSSKSGVIGGLNQQEMVVYIFMVYVTTSVVMVSVSNWVSDDVVKGTVAMNLIKPIDYRISLISMAMGRAVYQFLAPSIFIWIGVEVYKAVALGQPMVSVTTVIIYLCSCMMSFFIYTLFDFCFGMIAFFTTYIFGLRMAKEALLSFLTGQLIPISLFPAAVQRVFEYLPFSSMVYTPVMIYLEKYTGQELAFVLLRQAVWVVILYALGSLIWHKVTRRLVVLGG
ncbi:MAG: ABC-2 family transporter protein [Lachnospiraceae bacterium]|nr:ABC-2 family transporter protein [Lachnospiraceae bacterium]